MTSCVSGGKSLKRRSRSLLFQATISDTTARAIVGGVYRILHRGVSKSQLELVPDLATWAASYYPAPRQLTASRAGRARAPEVLASRRHG